MLINIIDELTHQVDDACSCEPDRYEDGDQLSQSEKWKYLINPAWKWKYLIQLESELESKSKNKWAWKVKLKAIGAQPKRSTVNHCRFFYRWTYCHFDSNRCDGSPPNINASRNTYGWQLCAPPLFHLCPRYWMHVKFTTNHLIGIQRIQRNHQTHQRYGIQMTTKRWTTTVLTWWRWKFWGCWGIAGCPGLSSTAMLAGTGVLEWIFGSSTRSTSLLLC